MKKIDFLRWPNSYLLSNGPLELVVPSSFGPRILSLSISGSPNIFYVESDGPAFRAGHSFQYGSGQSPMQEQDHSTVGVEVTKGQVRLRQRKEEPAKMVREIDIRLFKDKSQIEVDHRLYNENAFSISACIWAATAFPLGGVGGFVTVSSPKNGEVSIAGLNLLGDSRLGYHERCVTILGQAYDGAPLQVSLEAQSGYAFYWKDGCLFARRAGSHRYTLRLNAHYFEIRCRSEETQVASGSYVEHTERWVAAHFAENPLKGSSELSNALTLIESQLGAPCEN